MGCVLLSCPLQGSTSLSHPTEPNNSLGTLSPSSTRWSGCQLEVQHRQEDVTRHPLGTMVPLLWMASEYSEPLQAVPSQYPLTKKKKKKRFWSRFILKQKHFICIKCTQNLVCLIIIEIHKNTTPRPFSELHADFFLGLLLQHCLLLFGQTLVFSPSHSDIYTRTHIHIESAWVWARECLSSSRHQAWRLGLLYWMAVSAVIRCFTLQSVLTDPEGNVLSALIRSMILGKMH